MIQTPADFAGWQNPAWSRMRGSCLFFKFRQPLVHLLHLWRCRCYLLRIWCRCLALRDWLEWLRVWLALLGQSLQLFSKCCNVLPRACWLRHFLHACCHLWTQQRNSAIIDRVHLSDTSDTTWCSSVRTVCLSWRSYLNKNNLQSNNPVTFVDSASCAAKMILIVISWYMIISWFQLLAT